MVSTPQTKASFPRKNRRHFFNGLACAVLLLAHRGEAAPLVLPDADLFYTSFESSESPSYPTGAIAGVNGWVQAGNSQPSAAEVITGGAGSYLESPDGSQTLRLINARNGEGVFMGSPYASLKFTETPLTGQFFFSGLTAFTGTVSESTAVISSFYLANAIKAQNFSGIIFGIKQHEGELRFFYQRANSEVAFGDAPIEEGVFYRFELAVDVAAKSYQINVYNYETNDLMASATDGVFRAGLAIDIDYLRFYNRSENGDNFTTYYDQIWISTSPIPEPGHVGLMMGAGLILVLAKSGLVPNRTFTGHTR